MLEVFLTGNFAVPDARVRIPFHGDLSMAIQAARIAWSAESGTFGKPKNTLKSGLCGNPERPKEDPKNDVGRCTWTGLAVGQLCSFNGALKKKLPAPEVGLCKV